MPGYLEAGAWGVVAGAALLVGALVGLYVKLPKRWISAVMAVGAGVLVSAVAFDLMDEAFQKGGFDAASIGLIVGAVVYFGADLLVSSRGAKHRKRSGEQQDGGANTGMALFLGSLLDGIPESLAIGVSLLSGEGVSWVFVAAVFLSNVPEGLSGAAGMKTSGRSTKYILGLWSGVILTSGLAAALGYLLLDGANPNITAGIQSFAAGAVLAMLASTMMPEAYEEGGAVVGLLTALGFLVAFTLGKLQS
ncbi:ZIP family zinc transporter [Deinococcus irradiatisoli]|uniref:ZIP family zinc transporter n=1 Tax=Deinococcus irradiatisoli TaxID=2202254 RepID=A0A2Z3JCD2_9DEIO|nr:ZIP family zinc transporter [Deinococcus irradiatisoli]AWN22827.1 ZIP family zinc transporter [Deinococcus irradiatisoli]